MLLHRSSSSSGAEYRQIFDSVILRTDLEFCGGVDVLFVSLQVYEPLMIRYAALEEQLLKDQKKSLHLL